MAGKSFRKDASRQFVNQFAISEEPAEEMALTPDQVELEPVSEEPTPVEPKNEAQTPAPALTASAGWDKVVTQKQTYNKHINLMVQEYTRDKLDEYAKADNKSRNDLINTILKEYITKRG